MALLEVRELSRSFGGLRAVDNVSFDVEAGSISAVIGPNGAGKTTLINILTGFLTPDTGTITLNGRVITGQKSHRLPHMGMSRTFQTAQIFNNMTVLENIMVGRHTKTRSGFFNSAFRLPLTRFEEKSIREKSEYYLDMVGLSDIADQPASGIPIGNQRLLEIGRALATEPEIILLDEPAAGLNTQETRMLGELIQKIKYMQITVIIVEHDMELVMDISDEIMVLNFGKKIAWGTPVEIQSDPQVISVYLGEEE